MHRSLLQLEQSFKPSILSKIDDPLLDRYGIELWLKRDDLLHPIISGNKWRKLKYIIDHALSENADTLVSMGGAYSNHLHALAFVGQALGLKTLGFIRGEASEKLTPTLQDLQKFGMTLQFVSRSEYRTLRTYKGCYDLPQLSAGQYWLPEGGAQSLALQGIGELLAEINQPFDVICVACGTGTTLAGLIKHAPASVSVQGFAALKKAGFLNADVSALLDKPYGNWHIHLDYHGGGFGEASAGLLAFIDAFEAQTGIALEPVYTGKLLFGIYDLIKKNYFKPGQRLLAIHTGGLQGKRGFSPCSAC
ncbi:pyridoxal-phosphate dependent enzyme [Methylosoma difficile]